MKPSDLLNFITTLGREYSSVLRIAGVEDVSGQDCYSVVADYLRSEVTPTAL